MKIKRFVGDSFPEVMKQAREQMGDEAVIIYSRKYKEGGLLGLFARERFEITVAMDENYPRDPLPPLLVETPESNNPVPISQEVGYLPGEILNEIRSMKVMVEDLRERIEDEPQNYSRAGRILLKQLQNRQIDQRLAKRIVKKVEDRISKEYAGDFACTREQCVQVVAELVKKPRGIELKNGRPRIVALIGPTGVGKTTTIAKLAARFSLMENRKVGLITIDTYRIAAVEQLKIYADIMGLPLEVIYKPGDLKTAIDHFSNRDLVFIDTAGRSPHNEPQMEELVSLVEEANPHEVILVLSATTKTEDLLETYKRFNLIKIDKIIFTKLDETTCYGPILNIISKTKKRLSYVTNGQSVPDDIELLDDISLAQLIVGDDSQP
ncbi:MAG: flagellar biosynthesis protein FlhF [Syntrophomonadales bacterium]|jgi:flagellar biosynthesis protein FlhF